MAVYHLSVKTFRRAAGQSATAAAAYRSGQEIRDKQTGQVHDYRKKAGVESSEIVLPRHAPGWAIDREQLWNKAEESEKRKNAVVAREFEIALPSELTKEQRRELAVSFAKELVARHGFAADVSIHQPSREGDQRNHHAHILVTTRRLGPEGFREKTRELDEKINRGPKEFGHWRERFAVLTNEALEKHHHLNRVDHRTLKAQGIDREPTRHRGPSATAIERRTQEPSRLTQERTQQQQAIEQARLAREQAAREQEAAEKRRREQEQKAAEPNRIPPRVAAWRGPTSKPTPEKTPSPIEGKAQEPSPPRQDPEQTPAPELRQEEPPKPTASEETAAQKRERTLAAMRERAAQLKQKAQEPAPQPELQRPPAIDKEQAQQQMRERAAQLRQERQPAPQAPEKAKPKEKDRGPER